MTYEKEIVREVEKYIVDLRSAFEGKSIFPMDIPEVKFVDLDDSAGMCEGDIESDENGNPKLSVAILFNKHFLTPENKKYFLENIIPHEVAHWGDVVLTGGYKESGHYSLDHGFVWEEIMKYFGAKPLPHPAYHMPSKKGYHLLVCSCSSIRIKSDNYKEHLNYFCDNECKEKMEIIKNG